jgi:hypothetical protein
VRLTSRWIGPGTLVSTCRANAAGRVWLCMLYAQDGPRARWSVAPADPHKSKVGLRSSRALGGVMTQRVPCLGTGERRTWKIPAKNC